MTRCIIVDDEAPARDLIRHHISGLEDFELLASFDNAIDAFTFLQKNAVDLAFLDIRMPKVSGLQLIRSLERRPNIIFTTAYREYAADGFEMDALDYLLKPITLERFMKSVSRFIRYHRPIVPQPAVNDFGQAYIFLKVGRGQVKIFLRDIVYIEGLSDYIKVHTLSHSYVASAKLAHMEEKLPEKRFARIHKSFIVALDRVSSYNSGEVTVNNKQLPLGRVFKAGFLNKIQAKDRKG
jgi:DNA-binding LytR/AlgR family response regulator